MALPLQSYSHSCTWSDAISYSCSATMTDSGGCDSEVRLWSLFIPQPIMRGWMTQGQKLSCRWNESSADTFSAILAQTYLAKRFHQRCFFLGTSSWRSVLQGCASIRWHLLSCVSLTLLQTSFFGQADHVNRSDDHVTERQVSLPAF